MSGGRETISREIALRALTHVATLGRIAEMANLYAQGECSAEDFAEHVVGELMTLSETARVQDKG